MNAIGGHLYATNDKDKSVIFSLFLRIFEDLSLFENANQFVKWWILQATTENDLPLVHLAAMNGKIDCIKVLYNSNIKFNRIEKRNGKNPLHAAAKFGQNECLKCLIGYKEDVNARDFRQSTSLMCVAYDGQVDCLKTLIENGAKINARGGTGDTPLHFIGFSSLEKVEDKGVIH